MIRPCSSRDGVVHLYYTACTYDGLRIISWIEHSTSLDLQNWVRAPADQLHPGSVQPGKRG